MYKIIFYVGLVLTVFFSSISVILFIRNDVAKMLGEITGWNAKMATLQRERHAKTFVPREISCLAEDENTECLKNEESEEIFLKMIEDIVVVHTK